MTTEQKTYAWRTFDRIINFISMAGIIGMIGFIFTLGQYKEQFISARSDIKELKQGQYDVRTAISNLECQVSAITGKPMHP